MTHDSETDDEGVSGFKSGHVDLYGRFRRLTAFIPNCKTVLDVLEIGVFVSSARLRNVHAAGHHASAQARHYAGAGKLFI